MTNTWRLPLPCAGVVVVVDPPTVDCDDIDDDDDDDIGDDVVFILTSRSLRKHLLLTLSTEILQSILLLVHCPSSVVPAWPNANVSN